MRWPWVAEKTQKQPQMAAAKPSAPRKSRVLAVRETEEDGDAVPTELDILPRKLAPGQALTDEQRELLLQMLAQWHTRGEIVEAIQRAYGLRISPDTVSYYNTHPKWEKHLRVARLSHLTKTMSVPIANKMIRMERLERNYQWYTRRGKMSEAINCLKVAREEMEPLDAKTDVRDIYINQQIAYFDRTQCEKRLAEMEQHVPTQEVIDATPVEGGVSEVPASVSPSQ